MDNDNLIEEEKPSLITGKSHISFSEISNWKSCSWSHKLKQIDKIILDEDGWGSSFGKAIHAACENFLKTRVMNVQIALDMIISEFSEKQFKTRESELVDVKPFITYATNILETLPEWFNKEFKNWTCIDAEHELREPIENHPNVFFKGFIDCIIECDGPRNKRVIWVIDFKTTGWGWDFKKRSDDVVKSQLIYYKNYWSKKTGTDPKSIRCGFVLLKRTAKRGQNHELFTISVGNISSQRSLTVIDDMFASLDRGMFLKNKLNCKFCPYKMTEHCPGTECT